MLDFSDKFVFVFPASCDGSPVEKSFSTGAVFFAASYSSSGVVFSKEPAELDSSSTSMSFVLLDSRSELFSSEDFFL